MKLVLKDFQAEAVVDLVDQLRRASVEADDERLQAVSLSSPTGSGKTIMITAAIERLLKGDEDHPPDRGATFLWITDQPELNEQTRRKMLNGSSVIGSSDMVVIDATFDEEVLAPGKVHFLNTQKLAKDKLLVTHGDKRLFTIWETISNTVRKRNGRFFVFIDEAHRGMSEDPSAREEASTIIQKFIKGSSSEIPPIPLIVGISATPDRFQELIRGTNRTSRPVNVGPEDVRASGLLKETITLHHPTEEQPADITMLRASVQKWRDFSKAWSQYSETQDAETVRPILVVQVEDGSGEKLSNTDIVKVIGAITDEGGPLPPTAFAHSFQEGHRLSVGNHELRYLPASEIDDDQDVQVILFKTSLNTGWDCPRAEVMMSFRPARDATLIAQLVGRMVRTPLARRIESDESLNTVALYLPHYHRAGLQQVVDRLTTPDPDILPPTKVESGQDLIQLTKRHGTEDIFDVLGRLPSYVIPRRRKSNQIRRLMKLARLLAHDGVVPDAPEIARETLLGALQYAHERLEDDERFKAMVAERGTLDIRAVEWSYGTALGEGTRMELDISRENLEDLFELAGRKLGNEGLHKAYWRSRVAEDESAKTKAKLEVFALSVTPDVVADLEGIAQRTIGNWFQEHRAAISALPASKREGYNELRRLAKDPEETQLTYPDVVAWRKASTIWPKHLYVDSNEDFPETLNGWEEQVIKEEIQREDVVGWLRNPDRKQWSLAVPYEYEGETKPLYPDFLVVRRIEEDYVVDLLDPHSTSIDDAPAKAAGLAKYAAKHHPAYGRIELIIVDGENVRRLDLVDEATRDRVKSVKTHEHLRELFSGG